MSAPKVYLGDGVYAEDDGYHVVLTTDNGLVTTNRICLDPGVVTALVRYVERLRSQGTEPAGS